MRRARTTECAHVALLSVVRKPNASSARSGTADEVISFAVPFKMNGRGTRSRLCAWCLLVIAAPLVVVIAPPTTVAGVARRFST